MNRSSGNRPSPPDRMLGHYRAALDLSEAIHEELGQNLNAYSNKEIEKELEKRQPIRYEIKKSSMEGANQHQTWQLSVSSADDDTGL